MLKELHQKEHALHIKKGSEKSELCPCCELWVESKRKLIVKKKLKRLKDIQDDLRESLTEQNLEFQKIRCCCGNFLTSSSEIENPYSLCDSCIKLNVNQTFDAYLIKKTTNIENEISQINKKLFLGNFSGSTNYQILVEKKVTHILVCGKFLG